MGKIDEVIAKYSSAPSTAQNSRIDEVIAKYGLPLGTDNTGAATTAAPAANVGGMMLMTAAQAAQRAAQAKTLPSGKNFSPAEAMGFAMNGNTERAIQEAGAAYRKRNEKIKAQNTAAATALKASQADKPTLPGGLASITGELPMNDATQRGRLGNVVASGANSGFGGSLNALAAVLRPGVGQGRTEAMWGEMPTTDFSNAVGQKMTAASDKLRADAEGFMTEGQESAIMAKDGLGIGGSMLVDAGIAGTQLAGDLGIAALTGGSALPSMALRAFGSGEYEARQAGATDEQALEYGLITAGVEVLTERISSVATPFKKFGKGTLDDIVEGAIEKAASTPKGYAALKLLASGVSEGGEEFISSLANPIAQFLTYDDKALGVYRDSEYWKGALSDAVVGGILGLAGGSVDIGKNYNNYKGLMTGAEYEAQKNTASGEAVNGNGLRQLSNQEMLNLSSGVRNKIVSTFNDTVAFVKNALSDKSSADKAYMGKVTQSVADMVMRETGVDISDYNAILPSHAVRHMFNQHGDASAETKRGQVAVTPELAAQLPTILSSPDRVYLSDNLDAFKRKTLMFEKLIGDNYVTAQAVTDGTKSLTTDTLYIQKKSSHDTTSSADTNINLEQTSKTTSPQSSFNTTIINPENGVVNSDYAQNQAANTYSIKNINSQNGMLARGDQITPPTPSRPGITEQVGVTGAPSGVSTDAPETIKTGVTAQNGVTSGSEASIKKSISPIAENINGQNKALQRGGVPQQAAPISAEEEALDDYMKALMDSLEPPVEEISPVREAVEERDFEDYLTSLQPGTTVPDPQGPIKSADLDEYFTLLEDVAQRFDSPTRQRNPDDMISPKMLPTAKTLKEKTTDAWSYFKRKMVDAGDTVTKIGKITGDKSLYSYYNLARASSQIGASMIADAQTDVLGNTVGQSLNAIMDPIRAEGDAYYNKFQSYMYNRHNVERMSRKSDTATTQAEAQLMVFDMANPDIAKITESALEREVASSGPNSELAQERLDLIRAVNKAHNTQNKPIFGWEFDAEYSKAEADRLLQENPKFAEHEAQIRKYIDNLMQYRVDSGLITAEDAAALNQIYPHYVPTYRVSEKKASRALNNSVQIGKTVGRAQGSEEVLMPLHTALARQTMSVSREGSKNRFGMRLMDAYDTKDKNLRKYIEDLQEYDGGFSEDTFDIENDPTPQRENSFIVRQGGKQYDMTVDPSLFEAVKALAPTAAESNAFTKVVRASNDLFKKLVTGYNPMFTVRNLIRDAQTAGLYSTDLKKWGANYPRALNEIRANGPMWQKYKALGGSFGSIFDYNIGEAKEHSKTYDKTLGRVEALNQAIEAAPRLAEFMTVLENGDGKPDNLMDAMLAAQDVTVNFGRSGSLGKVLNANYVPFLNPGIQGFDKLVRTFSGKKTGTEWAKLVVKAAALGIVPAVINELLYSDDEEWDKLRQSDIDTNYLIKIGDGLWLKIPKGRELSILGMTADRIGTLLRGDDVDWGEFITTVGNQVAPANPLKSNILTAINDTRLFDSDDPGRTWYGSDIESKRLQNYAPGERYDESTDLASKWLGEKLNLSPAKINYLIDQYSGIIGDVLLPLLTPQAEQNPVAKAFTLDNVRSNRLSGEFYDTLDNLLYSKNSGDEVAAVTYRFWNKQNGGVSDVYSEIRAIENNTELTDKEKREQVRDLRAVLNTVMGAALNLLPAYEAAVNELISERPDADADEIYREANRQILGAEEALKTYNKDVYSKATESGVSYEDYYDYYFGYKERNDEDTSDTKAKYEALLDTEMSDVDKLAVFQTNFADSADKKAEIVTSGGVSMDNYLQYLIDASGTTGAKGKYHALKNNDMSDADKMVIYWAEFGDDAYQKAREVTEAGVSIDNYLQYLAGTSGMTADKDVNGNSITDSKREKVLAYIDGMDITNDQKDVLYRAAKYAESRIDEAPWRSGISYSSPTSAIDDVVTKYGLKTGWDQAAVSSNSNTSAIDAVIAKYSENQ